MSLPKAKITVYLADKIRKAYKDRPEERIRLVKTFGLDAGGKLIKGAPGIISTGRYYTHERDLPALLKGLGKLDEQRCIGLGTADKDKGKIGFMRNAIRRTKDNFRFREESTFCFIDVDGVDKNRNEMLKILSDIIPDFDDAGKLIIPSSSAGLLGPDGKNLNDSTSLHIYFIVQDGTDIPRFIKILFDRLWLAGHGHFMISGAPAMLKRGLIDASVGSPERLIYEGKPLLLDGITQVRPKALLIEGGMLDTFALPDLDDDELRHLEAIVSEARAGALPELDTAIEETVFRVKKEQGISEEQARDQVKNRRNMFLDDGLLLYFSGEGAGIPAGEVLSNGEKWDKKNLADPLEPNYGGGSKTKAIFYWNEGKPVVYSHIHWGCTYKFVSMEDGGDKEWPEPLEISRDLPPVEEMIPEMIPEPLREWVFDVSSRMQVPPDMIIAPLIVVLGSVIGTSLCIRPKQKDDWTIVPNLWGGVVGPPSVLKSPTLNEAVNKTLGHLESRARKEHEQAQLDYSVVGMLNEAKSKAIKEEINRVTKAQLKGKSTDKGPEELSEEFKALQEDDTPPTERRYKTNDASIEKIVELLEKNPRGLLYFRDELIGLFKRMERNGNEQDRAFLLESWNGDGSHVDDRIGRGTVRTDNLCISLLGGVQPDKIARYLSGALHEGENDGFVQRLQLMVYPDQVQDWQYVDRRPDTEAKNRAYRIVEGLAHLELQGEEDEPNGQVYLRFDNDAQELFKDWLIILQREKLASQDDHPVIQEHLAKYRSLMPTLALIFHLVEMVDNKGVAPGRVGAHNAAMAAAWCQYLETHARRIYSLALNADQAGGAKLAEKIGKGKLGITFKVRDVQRKCWSMLKAKEEIQAAVDYLVDQKYLREEQLRKHAGGNGRPEAVRYNVNPKIFQNA